MWINIYENPTSCWSEIKLYFSFVWLNRSRYGHECPCIVWQRNNYLQNKWSENIKFACFLPNLLAPGLHIFTCKLQSCWAALLSNMNGSVSVNCQQKFTAIWPPYHTVPMQGFKDHNQTVRFNWGRQHHTVPLPPGCIPSPVSLEEKIG